MKRLIYAVAAAALALSACETATPYQPVVAGNPQSGGYSDQQIEANRWMVTFSGNELTSRETVERYLLFRAAELTLNQGYDWFQTADRNTNKQSSYIGDAPVWGGYWGPRWGVYRRGYGWGYGYWGDPFWGGPLDVQQVSQYSASAEIVMGHGAKPNDPRAFDAHAVVEHLRGTIKYPSKPS
jgi:opacity protein-like surface antigen